MNTLAARWRELSPPVRVITAIVAFVVGINVALAAVGNVTGGGTPGGPAASAFATGSDGLAAYADLLRKSGHDVTRLRNSLDHAPLDVDHTLVIAEPDDVTAAEERAVTRFVRAGGRLVAIGFSTGDTVAAALGTEIEWGLGDGNTAHPLVPAPEVASVTNVVGSAAVLGRTGAAVPVLGASDGPTAAVGVAGAGRVVVLADSGPLENGLLADADNAAFGLAIAGPSRPVDFAEAQHGYARSGSGFSAIPADWRWGLAGLALAAAVAMWARGRRFGPPESAARELPPPRQLYVTAVATALARTRAPADAAARLQIAGKRHLAERAGIGAGASDDVVRASAARVGLGDDDVAALFIDARSDSDLMAVARAAACVQKGSAS
jgi:hypothetical protein